MSLYDEVQELKKENEALKRRVEDIEKKVLNITGSPIIVGYQGMKLTLNDSLDAVEVKGRLKVVEAAI